MGAITKKNYIELMKEEVGRNNMDGKIFVRKKNCE